MYKVSYAHMNQKPRKKPKLFISYSHDDEGFLKELKKHLKPLERNGVISAWTDQELIAGDELDEELLAQLESSDLIAFLVSSSFLSSISCYEKEFIETLDRRKHERVEIIPVIIRDCLWQQTPIARFLATPKNGVAVANSTNRDSAWVEVAKQIMKRANKWSTTNTDRLTKLDARDSNDLPKISETFVSWRNSTEVVFQHKFKDKLTLSDVFVFPDLRGIRNIRDELEETVNSSSLCNVKNIGEGILIHGDEQSGKTSLIKILHEEYYSQGLLPLAVDASQITNSDPKRAFRKFVQEQFIETDWEEFLAANVHRVLLLDNLHQIKLNTKFQHRLLISAKQIFQYIILVADSSITFDEQRMVELAPYRLWELLPFGHVRRGDLIDRWNSLGREEIIDKEVLHRQNDTTTRYINSVLMTSVIPPRPIYVLTALQLLDWGTPTDFSLTSIGYCYQVLIQRGLANVGVSAKDLDPYVNYLSELAYAVFSAGNNSFDKTKFESFKQEYSKKFLIKSHDTILEKLHAANIISSDEEHLRFSYRYIFYFYAAKYLADHLDEVDKDIESICERMHTERNANILIFLMHHTRDQRVIDDVLLRAYVIFDGVSPALLDNMETNHIIELVNLIPEAVVEQIDVDTERRKELERRDEIDNNRIADENSAKEEEYSDGLDEHVADIIRSARMVEVIGQILRNRAGSLHRPQLLDLASSGYECGLKFLSFWLDITKREKKDLIAVISDILKKELPAGEEQIRRAAIKTYLSMTYGVCVAVIQKIAHSMGSDELIEIFRQVEEENPDSIAIRLINVAIGLEFTKEIPKRKIRTLNKDLKSNPIGRRLLKEVIIQHLYLNEVPRIDKQWISDSLGISMEYQRLVGGRTITKK